MYLSPAQLKSVMNQNASRAEYIEEGCFVLCPSHLPCHLFPTSSISVSRVIVLGLKPLSYA